MFTNWLTSDISNKSREDNATAPDVLIEVGQPPFARFPAHSTVISSQSGYFRAAVLRISESGKLLDTPIFLPNINVEHFTPLLTYMYTGYLELNFDNIFGVLLATHLLHMPRALEICREFLAQAQRQQNEFFHSSLPPVQTPSTSSTKVIRPIASKPSNYGLNFISPPKASNNLVFPSHGTKFKSLSNEHEIPLKIIKLNEGKSSRKMSEDEKVTKKNIPSIKPSSSPLPVANQPTKIIGNSSNELNDKVVIDIASCDGPVRFRRVLNEAYEHNKHPSTATPTTSTVISEIPNETKYQSNTISFHQQMVRNINEQYNKQKSANCTGPNSEESENSQHSMDLFTCVYCNHTFKSKYCYQKHAKRHINPLNPLGRCRVDDCESSDSEGKNKQQQTSVKRDSIKPLDMNVQYYPCKFCGCKFPSYYFVHKHRKMCHPEVEADGNGNLIQNTVASLSQNDINEESLHKNPNEINENS